MSSVEQFARPGVARSRMLTFRAPGIALIVFALQLALLVGTALATGLAYHLTAYQETGELSWFAATGFLAGLGYLLPLFLRHDTCWYEVSAIRRDTRQVAIDWTLALVVVTVIAFVTKTSDMLSRGAILLLYGGGFGVLVAVEFLAGRVIAAAFRSERAQPRSVMIVGDGDLAQQIVARLAVAPDLDVVGVRSLALSAFADVDRGAVDAMLERAVSEARRLQAEDVVLAIPITRLDAIERCVAAFSLSPVEIHLGDDELQKRFAGLKVGQVGPVKTLRLSRAALSPLQALVKRVADIVIASIGMLLLAPILPIVALLIKLDSPGPVFFLQNRRGYNLRDFRIIKFRTMTTLDNGDVVVQAKRDDPRITRVGAWLRRLNVDELPQLINVIKGDMSIVGPRPHALAHDNAFEKRIARYPRRLNVRPGITGWAQVNGLRGETDTEDKMARRVVADLHYIDHWSLFLDLRIILLTVLSPRAYRNAR